MNNHEAIYQLHSNVVTIRGDVAYDAYDNEVPYNIMTVDNQVALNNCKAQATTILQATDWTSIGDVGNPQMSNPQMSNPYLVNQAEFITYRSQVRALAVNPVANPVFPTQPTAQWSS